MMPPLVGYLQDNSRLTQMTGTEQHKVMQVTGLHQNFSRVREDSLHLAHVGLALLVDHRHLLLPHLLPPHRLDLSADHEDHHGEVEHYQALKVQVDF